MALNLARMSWPERVVAGEVFMVRILVQHPMETGYLQDNEGRIVPRNVIQTLTCHWVGEGMPPKEVFRVEPSSGISANPLFEFYLRATRSGELWLRWIDDAGQMGQLRQVLVVHNA
jgi:sulfur-oxidizing protein SoxZ